ncbi:MAG: hypothetical protein H0X67_12865 [Acidobacteria bacterium]|nr:hypothetical protein [Acidobacteriota bacterium]
MKVLRDVVVDRTEKDELLAVSHLPGVVGEVLSLDLLGAGSSLELKVKVLDSRPVIVNGAVRHRLRLAMMAAIAESAQKAEEAASSSVPVADAGYAAAEAG